MAERRGQIGLWLPAVVVQESIETLLRWIAPEDAYWYTFGQSGMSTRLFISTGARRWLEIALVSIAGLITGIVYLSDKSFWLDESFSYALSRPSQATVWHRFGSEINMALYHEVLHYWLLLGTSDFDVRLLSLVFAVATVPLLYLLVERLYERRAAMTASVLLVMSPFFVAFAQQARAYALSLLFATAMTLLFADWVQTGSRAALLGYTAVAGASSYVHFFLAFVVVAHFVSLVFLARDERPQWRTQTIVLIVIAASASPAAYLAHRQSALHPPISAKPSIFELVKILKPLTGSSRLLAVLFLVAVLLFAAYAWRRRGSGGTWSDALLLCWLVVPILGAWLISQDRSIWVAKYFIVSLPPLVVIATIGALRVSWRWLSAAFLVLLVVLSGRLVWTYYGDHSGNVAVTPYPVENWRDLAGYLASHARPGDGLVVYAPYTRIPLDHYLVGHSGRVNLTPLYPRLSFSDKSLDANNWAYRPLTASQLRAISLRERGRRVWVVLSHNSDQHKTNELISMLVGRAKLVDLDFAEVRLQLFGLPRSAS